MTTIKELIRDEEKILEVVGKLSNMAVTLWDYLDNTITFMTNASSAKARTEYFEQFEIEYDHFLEAIEKLNELEMNILLREDIPQVNKNAITELITIQKVLPAAVTLWSSENVDTSSVESALIAQPKIKKILQLILTIEKYAFSESTKKQTWFEKISLRPGFHGTTLAVIFCSMVYGQGMFGTVVGGKTFLYTKEENANVYSESTRPIEDIQKVYASFKKDFYKDVPQEYQKEFLQGFVLEFLPEVMAEAKMRLVEEGRVEFVLPRAVSLRLLTKKCKQELAEKLHLKKHPELYELLFS